jgi:hypothetical protein
VANAVAGAILSVVLTSGLKLYFAASIAVPVAQALR